MSQSFIIRFCHRFHFGTAHIARSTQRWPSVLAALSVTALALSLAACDADIRDDDPNSSGTASPSSAATASLVTALPIHTPTVTAPGSTPEPGNAFPTPPPVNPETYVVLENDTLYGIALKFGVDLDDIISLNGLADPNDIQIGQELKIPPRQ